MTAQSYCSSVYKRNKKRVKVLPTITIGLAAIFAAGAGCSSSPGSASDSAHLGNDSKASADASLRLYVLDCGSIQFADVSPFGLTNDETAVRDLAVPCYLIDHPDGKLLWDAGLPAALAGNSSPVPLPSGQGTVVYKTSLEEQLSDLELTPADIDKIAFSHMHFDHTGSANLFGNSQMLIQQTEFTAAFEDADKFEGIFVPELYSEMANARRRILNGDHDVFGDGSVKIISAPGHTPGHQVLQINLANSGPIILSGDLYHFKFSRENRRVPTFNYSPEATLESMDKIEALVKSLDATFWIQHDKALYETLRHSPASYR